VAHDLPYTMSIYSDMSSREVSTVDKLESVLSERLPECLQFLELLVSENSFTGNADGVNANADLIAARFKSLGFSERRVPCRDSDAGDHLILDSGGTAPAIACVSHLDTVFPSEEEKKNQFHWQREGDIAYGPGTYDIKGGTALLWLMFTAMAEVLPEVFGRFRWILLWNAAEERLVSDFFEVCQASLPESTEACLVFEGDNERSENFALIQSRKGMAKFRIRVEGRGGHAGNYHVNGANAIHQLARLVCRAEELTDYSRDLTVNVGVIRGGVVANRVPEEAEAVLEMRAYDPKLFEETRAKLLAFAGQGEVSARSDGHPCQITVTEITVMPPWELNEPTKQLVNTWREAGASVGVTVHAGKRGGVSDANPIASRFPTLDGLGPRGGNPHVSAALADGKGRPEFVDISSFKPKALVNLLALHQWNKIMR